VLSIGCSCEFGRSRGTFGGDAAEPICSLQDEYRIWTRRATLLACSMRSRVRFQKLLPESDATRVLHVVSYVWARRSGVSLTNSGSETPLARGALHRCLQDVITIFDQRTGHLGPRVEASCPDDVGQEVQHRSPERLDRRRHAAATARRPARRPGPISRHHGLPLHLITLLAHGVPLLLAFETLIRKAI
jgi:hypothetical protein